MVREPRGRHTEDEPPSSLPKGTPPVYAQPTHDFTLQAVMEMQKSQGELIAKIQHLLEEVGKISTRLSGVERSVDRVWTGAIVGGTILSLVGALLWFAIGDRVTSAVRTALTDPAVIRPVNPPAPPKAP